MLDQKITIQVFRIVQECLTNIVRHALAKQANISLEIVHPTISGKALRLRITDDGQDCAAEMIKTGFGLLGMRERLDILGGELTIQTQPQQGISVIVKYSIEMKNRIKVILVDDHAIVRAGFRMLLSTED